MKITVSLTLIATAIFSCILNPHQAYAEKIYLKSGKSAEGKLLEKTDKYIKIEVNGVPITYYMDEILKEEQTPAQAPEQTQKKTSVKYRIAQKFILKANQDVNFLKFSTVVPRKDIAGQVIGEIETFPKSNATFKDNDGNDVEVYYSTLLKSQNSFITGFRYDLELDTTPLNIKPDTIPDTYPVPNDSLKKYLASEGDIKPDEATIKEKAASITAAIKNPYQKTRAIYDFITANFRYDFKMLEQLKSNPQAYHSQSPQDTLVSKKGICYDFAKLFVALSRANGIPSRVVRGLAFDFKPNVNFYVENYGHAWAEVYLPVYGWVPIDPTFGISQRESFFCFNYKSHIPQEYGLSEVEDIGSLEKGWTIQVRSQTKITQFPIKVTMQAELIRNPDVIKQN